MKKMKIPILSEGYNERSNLYYTPEAIKSLVDDINNRLSTQKIHIFNFTPYSADTIPVKNVIGFVEKAVYEDNKCYILAQIDESYFLDEEIYKKDEFGFIAQAFLGHDKQVNKIVNVRCVVPRHK